MATPTVPSTRPWLRWTVFSLIMAGMAWAYVFLAEKPVAAAAKADLRPQEVRHLELTRATQQDFAPDFSRSFSEPLKRLAPHRTDGLVQPLWPWVAAFRLVDADLAGSFRDLAWFRIGLSLAALLFLGVVCARQFALPAALLVVAATGFHGLLGTVAIYSGATLFHLSFLLTWLACIYALHRNSLWVYGVVGLFGGLAYLSMDRILPLLAVFIFVSTVRALWGWILAHWCHAQGTTLWVRRNHVFGLILLAAAALSVSGPRLSESHQRFGQAAFQYLDYIRWLDGPEEARAWMAKHPDRQSLEKLSPLDLPSPSLYFQTHTPEQISTRLTQGLRTLAGRLHGRGGEPLAVLALLIAVFVFMCRLATPKACHAGERLHPETIPTVLFILLAAAGYTLIAAWDIRVMQAQFLQALTGPLTLSLVWGCESVLKRARRRGARPWIARSYQAVMWILLGITLYQAWQAYAPNAAA